MEIGSFIELQFPKGKEHYKGKNTARLNSGRAAIYHSLRVLHCKTVWLPYYQCETVQDFLRRKQINIKFYNIDNSFTPVNLFPESDEAVLLVNYFGIMQQKRMAALAAKYSNVIIDNSQAFFCGPIENCMNVYSARKFVGVPDGAYVIGNNVDKYIAGYEQGFSSDTSLFMIQRIEYGCQGKAYTSRTINEERIDKEDIMRMSVLTHTILDGTDYNFIKKNRTQNFNEACGLFDTINEINPKQFWDEGCVPMVYPLMLKDENLLQRLIENGHFQGHWWKYVTGLSLANDFEKNLSHYMVPITIDQRYGKKELLYLQSIVYKK